ncbi:MAG: hypothetical protein DMF68_16525, partial [Acidobacteria bacterium]
MKNDEHISPKFGSSRLSIQRSANNSKLFLTLTIIMAILLSSCAKDRKQDQVTYNATATPSTVDGRMSSNTATTMEKQEQIAGEEKSPFNTESYSHLDENPFLDVAHAPLSTFSI